MNLRLTSSACSHGLSFSDFSSLSWYNRYDKIVNLGMALLTLTCLTQVGMGIHKMAYGYGKKEGF